MLDYGLSGLQKKLDDSKVRNRSVSAGMDVCFFSPISSKRLINEVKHFIRMNRQDGDIKALVSITGVYRDFIHTIAHLAAV
jgi:hypothetical protein